MRVRVEEPEGSDEKVDFSTDDMSDVVPSAVRIEVAGGRSSTASAMRAARVQSSLERVGAKGSTVELEGEYATVSAEADRAQIFHIARIPFVKKITLVS